ncbi:hypothetical protein MG290_09390 [Flavobacterium sp. CBA20B-1]|uniref:hypothetical protein n=1 Tax=unclassified Flavobacterium TaxID=196869 RepID=UPI0022254B47|nr:MULTISPECIES: hypothetical protein [unclassified Flavobacterium]WCM41169.1 hypothetical protein MG290_09390 [Flavobacterium sp. CBA20B-1]
MKKAVLYITMFIALCFGFKTQAQNTVVNTLSVTQALDSMSVASQDQLKERLYGQTSFTYITAQGVVDAVESTGKPFDVIEIEDLSGSSALNNLTWQLQQCKVLIVNVNDTIPSNLNFNLFPLRNLEYVLIKGYNHNQVDAITLLVAEHISNKNMNSTILIEKLKIDR